MAQVHAYAFNYIAAKIYGTHQQVPLDLCHSEYDLTHQITYIPETIQHENQQKL